MVAFGVARAQGPANPSVENDKSDKHATGGVEYDTSTIVCDSFRKEQYCPLNIGHGSRKRVEGANGRDLRKSLDV